MEKRQTVRSTVWGTVWRVRTSRNVRKANNGHCPGRPSNEGYVHATSVPTRNVRVMKRGVHRRSGPLSNASTSESNVICRLSYSKAIELPAKSFTMQITLIMIEKSIFRRGPLSFYYLRPGSYLPVQIRNLDLQLQLILLAISLQPSC